MFAKFLIWLKEFFAAVDKANQQNQIPQPVDPNVDKPVATVDNSVPSGVIVDPSKVKLVGPRPMDLPPSNHYASKTMDLLLKEYQYLWTIIQINEKDKAQVEWAVKKAKENQVRYQKVAERTGIPWFVIAAIHMKEASFSFDGILHNGEKIIGKGLVTKLVPKGRGPFATWEDAAWDALNYEGYVGLSKWNLGTSFYRLEMYNGSGYRTGAGAAAVPANASPYIYAASQFYKSGQYIESKQADGSYKSKFEPQSVANDVGCMTFLKALELSGAYLWDDEGAQPNTVNLDKDILLTLGAKVGVGANAINDLIAAKLEYSPGGQPRFYAAVDFSQHSSKPRFHLFDVVNETVKSYLVSHGKGSEGKTDDGMADIFSNVPGSNASSLGVYRGMETYVGKHGTSLRLDGLSASNSNVRSRDIVIHGAEYVSFDVVKQTGRVGRSEGCFALDPNSVQEVITALKGGSLIVAFK